MSSRPGPGSPRWPSPAGPPSRPRPRKRRPRPRPSRPRSSAAAEQWGRYRLRMRAAVFLDRDDTLMAANSSPAPPPPCAPGDVIDPGLVLLLPGVLDACRRLKRAGFALVVISNQGVVARG